MKSLKLGIVMLFHPVVAFRYMQKDRDSFHYYPVWVLMALTIVVRIFSIYFTHWPLATVNAKSANLLMQCAVIFVPLLSWVVTSYAITTILGGEALFRENLLSMAYCLIPYIILQVPLTIASRFMDSSAAALYHIIGGVAIAWVVVLLIMSLKVMNHYSGGKTVGILFLSLFTMILLWAAIALGGALTMRFVNFIKEVVTEFRYKLMY